MAPKRNKQNRLINNVPSLKKEIHQEVMNKKKNYEAKQVEKVWGNYINDLMNHGIEIPEDFVQYIKEKGVKLTKNTDLIYYISNELHDEKKISNRQNIKGNKVLKNIYINSKCLHHPEEMAMILCQYIKGKCNVEDPQEEMLISSEIKAKIDNVQGLAKVSIQSDLPNFSYYDMDMMNSFDDYNDDLNDGLNDDHNYSDYFSPYF